MTDELLKLIDNYGNACIKAGQANNGSCFDVMAAPRMQLARDLKTELIEAVQAVDGEKEIATLKKENTHLAELVNDEIYVKLSVYRDEVNELQERIRNLVKQSH